MLVQSASLRTAQRAGSPVQLPAEEDQDEAAGISGGAARRQEAIFAMVKSALLAGQFIRHAFRSSGITDVASRIYSLVIVLPLPAAPLGILRLSSSILHLHTPLS